MLKSELFRSFLNLIVRKETDALRAMAGYYKKLYSNLSTIAALLTHLFSKQVKFEWTEKRIWKLESRTENCTHSFSTKFQSAMQTSFRWVWCSGWCCFIARRQWLDGTPSFFFSHVYQTSEKLFNYWECRTFILTLQHLCYLTKVIYHCFQWSQSPHLYSQNED